MFILYLHSILKQTLHWKYETLVNKNLQPSKFKAWEKFTWMQPLLALTCNIQNTNKIQTYNIESDKQNVY
jgi:hypothetical protein